MSLIDGLDAAAKREVELHPKTPKGAPITAWERRAETLKEHAKRIDVVEARLAALEAQPPHPFP